MRWPAAVALGVIALTTAHSLWGEWQMRRLCDGAFNAICFGFVMGVLKGIALVLLGAVVVLLATTAFA
jgi:hypothetical protein